MNGCPYCGSGRSTYDDGARVCERCGAVFPEQEAPMEGTPLDPDDLGALGERIARTLHQTVVEAVDATRAAEAVGAAVLSLKTPLQFLKKAFEVDPELAPELSTAVKQIEEASAALERSSAFIVARFQVKLAEIAKDLGGTTEGDPT